MTTLPSNPRPIPRKAPRRSRKSKEAGNSRHRQTAKFQNAGRKELSYQKTRPDALPLKG